MWQSFRCRKRPVWNPKIQLWPIDSGPSIIIPSLIDRSELVTFSISYVITPDICLLALYVNVVEEICSVMRLHYTDCDFCVMLQCFSWHNLRYIKNQLNPGMPLMPLLLSCSRGSCLFIIGGSRVHVCSACRLASPKYIYSPHALNRSATDERFYSKCDALCITRNGDLILLPPASDPGFSESFIFH